MLVIDVQDSFLDGWTAGDSEPLLTRLAFLFGLAAAYDLPCLATFEEPVAGKGRWPAGLAPEPKSAGRRVGQSAGRPVVSGEPSISAEALRSSRRPADSPTRRLTPGTDVCVLQSVLGVLALGKRVVLLEDALFSEEPHVGPAIRRMEAAGAIPSTVKTLAYELRRSVAEPTLAQRLAERGVDHALPSPEDLPDWRPAW